MRDDLKAKIVSWGLQLGFQKVGVSKLDLADDEARLHTWLEAGHHGEMEWMRSHGNKRSRPTELRPGTLSVISARMNYLPEPQAGAIEVLNEPSCAYISRYALGRDYHKVMRKRLLALADKISAASDDAGYRVFTDSAPVLEKPLARQAGLGWVGKHTNIIDRDHGSWFFLGEIYIDTLLPPDEPTSAHCGSCRACIDVCPTDAIVAPYQLDARRCISYLTIEHRGPIPLELRHAIGNRIYGCDDCQLFCPWNRYAQVTNEEDFHARHGLQKPSLLSLFEWTEAQFLRFTEGSAMRRVGYTRFLRNIAVALGNAPASAKCLTVLSRRLGEVDELVAEHIRWAIDEQQRKLRDSAAR